MGEWDVRPKRVVVPACTSSGMGRYMRPGSQRAEVRRQTFLTIIVCLWLVLNIENGFRNMH